MPTEHVLTIDVFGTRTDLDLDGLTMAQTLVKNDQTYNRTFGVSAAQASGKVYMLRQPRDQGNADPDTIRFVYKQGDGQEQRFDLRASTTPNSDYYTIGSTIAETIANLCAWFSPDRSGIYGGIRLTATPNENSFTVTAGPNSSGSNGNTAPRFAARTGSNKQDSSDFLVGQVGGWSAPLGDGTLIDSSTWPHLLNGVDAVAGSNPRVNVNMYNQGGKMKFTLTLKDSHNKKRLELHSDDNGNLGITLAAANASVYELDKHDHPKENLNIDDQGVVIVGPDLFSDGGTIILDIHGKIGQAELDIDDNIKRALLAVINGSGSVTAKIPFDVKLS